MRLTILLMVVAVVSMVSVSNAATWRSQPSEDPAHAGKCWNPDTETLHNAGEEYTDHKNCVRVNCHADFSMSWASCGSIGASPPCRVAEGDLTKNYPDCCPNIVCD